MNSVIMINITKLSRLFLLASTTGIFFCGCKKDNNPSVNPTNYKLAYSDTVLYPLGEVNELQVVSPVTAKNGLYTSFPEGLDINPVNGNINIHESETGINYRVFFSSSDGSIKDSTLIAISGINFLDGLYKINSNDSIVNPVYNAAIANAMPGINNGSLFDEGGGCNSGGCAVNVANAKINLAQTVRNGTFGSSPVNGVSKDFTLNFRINDRSGKGGNKTKIKVFYFNKLSDITQQVWDLLNGRNGTIVNSFNNSNNTSIQGFTAGNITETARTGKGRRPPCIVILSQ